MNWCETSSQWIHFPEIPVERNPLFEHSLFQQLGGHKLGDGNGNVTGSVLEIRTRYRVYNGDENIFTCLQETKFDLTDLESQVDAKSIFAMCKRAYDLFVFELKQKFAFSSYERIKLPDFDSEEAELASQKILDGGLLDR